MEFLTGNPLLMTVIALGVLVFVIDLLGNSISFGNKIINALLTAIIFGAVMYGLGTYEYIELNQGINLKNIIG